jgi:hypothetical protein
MTTQPIPVALKLSPWPRWTVFRALLLPLTLLAPLVHAGFWTGHGRLVSSGFMYAFGLFWASLPIVLLVLAVIYVYSCRVPGGPYLRRRVGVGVLKFGWLLLLLGLLLITGSGLEEASLFVTQQRAKDGMAAVEWYRFRHGHYPDSFGEVEEDTGKPFPRPTVASEFVYAPRQNGYDFGFHCQCSHLHGCWRYDPVAKRWKIESD